MLLHHSDPETVALPMGFGVKFYTALADDTLVLSTTFKSVAMPRPEARVLKAFAGETPLEAWQSHRQRIPPLLSPALPAGHLAAFVRMAQQEEASLSATAAG